MSSLGFIKYLAALVGIAAKAPAIMDRPRNVGRHHPGPVGHGHSNQRNTSQRERGNRRSAKRAARVRRRG